MSQHGDNPAGPSWHGNHLKRGALSGSLGPSPVGPRPSIQVWFECAAAYQRVFRHVDGSSYHARCPKCGESIRFKVGPEGTGQRTFRVSC